MWPPRWLAPKAAFHAPADVAEPLDTTIEVKNATFFRVGDTIRIGAEERARVVCINGNTVAIVRGV